MANKVSGVLEVGRNDAHEVIVNHPDLHPDENGVGHIVFSIDQARNLARLLLRQADYAQIETVGDLKIFQMNDSEFYAALSLEDALSFMAEDCGFPVTLEGIKDMREQFEVETPCALPDSVMKTRTKSCSSCAPSASSWRSWSSRAKSSPACLRRRRARRDVASTTIVPKGTERWSAKSYWKKPRSCCMALEGVLLETVR